MNENWKKPNIILLVMDTVRADHLSCYGYQHKTSPNIDKLAKQGIILENAFSSAEWSPPSHASIFTGKYPSYHKTLGKNVFLNEENITLAEILNWNGYRTIGVSSNALICKESGFAKGFQEYSSLHVPYRSFQFIKQCPKDVIRTLLYGLDWFTYRNIEKIKGCLSKHNEKRPFFLFTNLFSCHAPHDPPRPFKKRFCKTLDEPPLYLIEYLFNKFFGRTGEKINNCDLDIRKLKYLASDDGQYSYITKQLQVSEEEWGILKSWYDGDLSYLDYRIGELMGFLEKKGILDDTLLILTSDHGENFGERGLASHMFCLYDSLIHVPLIMVYPNLVPKGKRISSLVSTIDIFPTVLDILNITGYRDAIQGRSLYPFENRKIHDFICAECGKSVTSITNKEIDWFPLQLRPPPELKKYDRGSKCLRTESYKYILTSDQREELYDLSRDPFERRNIVLKDPEKAKTLREQLEKTVDTTFFGPKDFQAKKEGREMINRLQALGYI